MAAKTRSDHYEDDDIISHCGSFSGETFASRRSKHNGASLRQHSVDWLARRLREIPNDDLLDFNNHKQSHDSSQDPKQRFNTCFHHYRFLMAMMGGFSVGTMFLLRYNITVSIIKMVNQTHSYLEQHPNNTVDDMIAEGYTPGGEFNWNNEIQHMIMSWYMFAYSLPQLPATKLGTMLGTRLTIPISLALCAISTLLTPMFAYIGWEYVILLRLINGLGASAVLPMLLALVENWMHPDEISLGLSLAQTISSILSTTNPILSGYLSSFHWSYSFYVPGICTLIFCVIWLTLVTDNPVDNRFISDKELRYICELDLIGLNNQRSLEEKKKAKKNDVTSSDDAQYDDGLDYRPNSWFQILRVPSFYCYIIIWCFYCSSYSGFTFILPPYLRQYLKITISQNGTYCSIVQCGCILAVMWPHPLLRLLQEKFNLSNQNGRRIAYLICCSMVAATWLYVGTFHESQLLLLFLNRCFHNGNDIIVTGCLMSNYAKAGLSSIVFSMVNTIGNLSVVFSSTFIGWLLDYTAQSDMGWRLVFSGLGVGQIIMWLIFATTVPSGPIRFNNQRLIKSKDAESNLHRSISATYESSPVVSQTPHVKQSEGSILNNFEKLKSAPNDENNLQEKPRESVQV